MLNNKLDFSEKKKNLLDLKRSPLFPLELCIVCHRGATGWVPEIFKMSGPIYKLAITIRRQLNRTTVLTNQLKGRQRS